MDMELTGIGHLPRIVRQPIDKFRQIDNVHGTESDRTPRVHNPVPTQDISCVVLLIRLIQR